MSKIPGRLRFEHEHVTTDQDLYDAGHSARKTLPRSAHADYHTRADRDPLGILDRQDAGRLPDLIPLRFERMLKDPFGFYRGTAALQAADLAGQPTTDAGVVICGDAHIANFGIFASPDGSLVFDVNDFDEATFGPWEWEVKRMVTSVVIAARQRGFNEQTAAALARTAVNAYRDGLRLALSREAVERSFRTARVRRGHTRFGPETGKVIDAAIRASEKRTSARAVEKLTRVMPDGSRQLVENPPIVTHLEPELESQVQKILDLYRETVHANVSLLLAQHTVTDAARLVVGVGSVGMRCFVIMLTGPHGEPLVLQLKQAVNSVIQEFGDVPFAASVGVDPGLVKRNPGYRVVSSQRILQAASDPFLGWLKAEGFSFYVRQYRNRSVSFDTATMSEETFGDYVTACGTVLAAGHARSPNGAFISGYIGSGETFADAVVSWSQAYADQSLADFTELQEAAAAGRYDVS